MESPKTENEKKGFEAGRQIVLDKDILVRIFELQRQFNLQVGLDTNLLDDFVNKAPFPDVHAMKERDIWLGRMHLAMTQELAEFRDSIPWKWWKAQELDLQNAKVEAIDLMHFLVSIFQLLGMTPDDVLRVYEKKMEVNLARQAKGYGTNPNTEGGATDCKHIQ